MGPRTLAALLVATGIGVIVFWVLFYTIDLAPAHAPVGYASFERAFLVPDTALAGVLVVGGRLLWRRHPRGMPLAAAGGGALTFLGLLDLSYGLQNGLYSAGGLEAVGLLAVAAWCAALGAGSLVVLLRTAQ